MEAPGQHNVFRKLVTTMLVAARRNNKSLDLPVITARLRQAMARGMSDSEMKAHVLGGLKDVPAAEIEKPVNRWNPFTNR